MKKLKLKALGLGAKEILTREQLKYVLGGSGGSGTGGGGGNTGGGSGGTCCAHNIDWGYKSCGLDKSTAIAYADQYASTSGQAGYWCCDSCAPQ
jgi:hypothetical protein